MHLDPQRPCLDAVLMAECDQLLLLQVGVQLNLRSGVQGKHEHWQWQAQQPKRLPRTWFTTGL